METIQFYKINKARKIHTASWSPFTSFLKENFEPGKKGISNEFDFIWEFPSVVHNNLKAKYIWVFCNHSIIL